MNTDSISPFCARVYAALSRVPKGYITTYWDLARAIGCRSAQAVGQALQKNPFSPKIPCHRVVCSNGSIGGFFGQRKKTIIRKKIHLLTNEGIHIVDGRIQNFSKKRFVFPAF